MAAIGIASQPGPWPGRRVRNVGAARSKTEAAWLTTTNTKVRCVYAPSAAATA